MSLSEEFVRQKVQQFRQKYGQEVHSGNEGPAAQFFWKQRQDYGGSGAPAAQGIHTTSHDCPRIAFPVPAERLQVQRTTPQARHWWDEGCGRGHGFRVTVGPARPV